MRSTRTGSRARQRRLSLGTSATFRGDGPLACLVLEVTVSLRSPQCKFVLWTGERVLHAHTEACMHKRPQRHHQRPNMPLSPAPILNPRYGMVRHGAINAPEAKRPSNATTATTSSSSLSSELMKLVVRGWVRPSKSSVASTLRHAADGVSQRIAEGCDEVTCHRSIPRG